MFTPCEMNTRPSASVMNPPARPNGAFGAATAEPANSAHVTAAATAIRIAGRLPHLAARDVHLSRPVTRRSTGARASGGAARLPLGLHDTRRRPRLADGVGRVRECVTVDPTGHGRAADLLAYARRHRSTGDHDRRDVGRAPDAGHRRFAPGDSGELVRIRDR